MSVADRATRGRSRLVVGAASASAALLLIGGMASAKANTKKPADPADGRRHLDRSTPRPSPPSRSPPPTTIVVRHHTVAGGVGIGPRRAPARRAQASGSGSSSSAAAAPQGRGADHRRTPSGDAADHPGRRRRPPR